MQKNFYIVHKIINCQYFWFLDPILNFMDKDRKVFKDREKRDIQGKKHFREIKKYFQSLQREKIFRKEKKKFTKINTYLLMVF